MFEQTYIVAEAGANHNGELTKAVELIHAAKEPGRMPSSFNTSLLMSSLHQSTIGKLLAWLIIPGRKQ